MIQPKRTCSLIFTRVEATSRFWSARTRAGQMLFELSPISQPLSNAPRNLLQPSINRPSTLLQPSFNPPQTSKPIRRRAKRAITLASHELPTSRGQLAEWATPARASAHFSGRTHAKRRAAKDAGSARLMCEALRSGGEAAVFAPVRPVSRKGQFRGANIRLVKLNNASHRF